jgi:hypothetical protein
MFWLQVIVNFMNNVKLMKKKFHKAEHFKQLR